MVDIDASRMFAFVRLILAIVGRRVQQVAMETTQITEHVIGSLVTCKGNTVLLPI